MSGQRSRARRTSAETREEFLERVGQLWDSFNTWYKAHPDATFDEMEEELGRQRRAVLGNFLELSLRQGDLGATPEAPYCERCRRPMDFKGYPVKKVHGLETDAKVPRAYYVCPTCEVGFFPLDRRLGLRRDSWSEGLVREAARLGTTQPSFKIAAETLDRLARVGISDTTVWRHHGEVTSQLETELEREDQEVPYYVPWKDMEAMEWIPLHDPIEKHASVSMDGVKIPVRDEGYREVKLVSVSEVVVEPKQEETSSGTERVTGCEEEPSTSKEGEVRGRQDGLRLKRHSYRAILGDKAAFTPALKGEVARRRVRQVDKITTVNDGGEWIWDLAQHYLPAWRVEALDWPHAIENLAKAGNAAWGEGEEKAQVWLDQRKTELWNGKLVQVEIGLEQLPRRYKERGQTIRRVKEYIDQHWKRLHYDRFRAEGRPIGSGTVESGAKNVVAWRMKRGGQRWTRSGATRMLAALGEVHSNRWDRRVPRLAKAA